MKSKKDNEEELKNMYFQGFGAGYAMAVKDLEEKCLPLMKKNKLKHLD